MYTLKTISGGKLVFLESNQYGSEVFKPEVINGRLQLINIIKHRRCCEATLNIQTLEPIKKSATSKCKFLKDNKKYENINTIIVKSPSSNSTPESSINEGNKENESDNSMQCPSIDSGYQSGRIRFTDISSILENANSVPDLTNMSCVVKNVNSTGNVSQDVISNQMPSYGSRWSLPSESNIKKNLAILSCNKNILQKTSSFDSGIQSQSGTFGSISSLGSTSFENTSNSKFKAPSSILMELNQEETKKANHSTPKKGVVKLIKLHRTPTKSTPNKVAKLVHLKPGSTPKNARMSAALTPPTVTKWRKCITPRKNYSRKGVDKKSNETKWIGKINHSEYFQNATIGIPPDPIYEIWTTKIKIDEKTMISAKKFKEQLANCSGSINDSDFNKTKKHFHSKQNACNLISNPVRNKCLANNLKLSFQKKCVGRSEDSEPRYNNLLNDISSLMEPVVWREMGFESI